MKLSPHITSNEMKCACCGICYVDQSIIDVAEFTRTAMNIEYKSFIYMDKPIVPIKLHISSGCRCPAWNKHEHGSKDSQHLTIAYMAFTPYPRKCHAIDGWFYYGNSIENRLDATDVLLRMYKDKIIKGLGLYDRHRLHIDTRAGRQWIKDYRSVK